MPSYDAIIIGAGTNGLAAAHRLAGSGRTVLVLESAPLAGGGATARGEAVAPGFPAPALAHLAHMIDPRVESAMQLSRHGLSFVAADLATTALCPDGQHLRLEGPGGARITGLSAKDQAAWAALHKQLMAFSGVLEPFRRLTPPRVAKGVGNEMLKLARLGLGVRMLGKDQFREFMRMLLINVYDVANDELDHPLLKGLLAHDATLGAWLGPRSPNSLILLLNRLSGQVAGRRGALALPKGGMGTIAAAMAASAIAAGVTIRTNTQVAGIMVENDRASGVTLTTGEQISAPLIVSAISPKTTLLSLVGPRHLDTGLITRLRHQKSRGAAAKLHLALKSAPDFRGADLKTRLVIAPSDMTVERAFNAVKYGEVPARPVMEIVLPSAHEEGHAPDGQHLLSAVIQFAPHAPDPNRDAVRNSFARQSLQVLEEYAPGIGDLVVGSEMLMPWDIEARYGMVGGNWHHGELSVEQMFFLRPLPGIAQYSTAISGLWLASAGCHPGGGISGAAGWNAAERIVKEARA